MKEEEIKRLKEKVKALQDEINRIKNNKILSCAGNTNVPLDVEIRYPFGNGNGMAAIQINGRGAYVIFESTNRDHNISYGHKDAMLFLAGRYGEWFTENGTEITENFLTFVPKGEN